MSQARLATCIPVPLENKALVNVIEKAKDWALMHGVGMRDRKNFTKDAIQVTFFFSIEFNYYEGLSALSIYGLHQPTPGVKMCTSFYIVSRTNFSFSKLM